MCVLIEGELIFHDHNNSERTVLKPGDMLGVNAMNISNTSVT